MKNIVVFSSSTSGCGKTLLIKKLIPLIKPDYIIKLSPITHNAGLIVLTLKDDETKNFKKDTGIFYQAAVESKVLLKDIFFITGKSDDVLESLNKILNSIDGLIFIEGNLASFITQNFFGVFIDDLNAKKEERKTKKDALKKSNIAIINIKNNERSKLLSKIDEIRSFNKTLKIFIMDIAKEEEKVKKLSYFKEHQEWMKKKSLRR